MKSFGLLLVIFFLANSRVVFALETRSSVEFQWEENEKAAEYEVQILNSDKKVLKELKSKTNNFKVKMPVDNYKIRGRIKTKLGNYSPWSTETDLVIPPNKIKLPETSARTRTFTADPKRFFSKITLKWTASPQAVKYIFKLKDADGKILDQQEISSASYSLELNPGLYKYSITAVAPNGLMSEEVNSLETLEIKATILAKPKYVKTVSSQGTPAYTFTKIPGVQIRGEFHYDPFLSEKAVVLEKIDELKEPQWQPPLQLKPGHYKIYFWSSAKGASNSEKISDDFIVKPKEADLL